MYDKVAVYSGTRDVYPQMHTAVKSLLLNVPMDRVYLFIEDDMFPYPMPKCVQVCNVSGQEFFPPGSANMGNRWTYMDLLRCCLATMLPEEKRVIFFDVDTIVDGDISELFDIDMRGYFFAGVPEVAKSNLFFRYINTGCTVHNLELLRAWKKEDEMIDFLNVFRFEYAGQDMINLLGQGRIKTIDSEFNSNMCSMPCHRPKVIHYAAIKAEDYKRDYHYRKYEAMPMPGLEEEEE